MSRSTRVDLPVPGAPVTPMTCARPRRAWRARRAASPRGSSASRRVMRRATARRSPRATAGARSCSGAGAMSRAEGMSLAGEARVGLDEAHDLAGVGPWPEDGLDALRPQRLRVVVGDDAAAEDDDVLGALLDQELLDLGEERHVGAREAGEADQVHVLLDGGGDDLLGRLAQPRVDD